VFRPLLAATLACGAFGQGDDGNGGEDEERREKVETGVSNPCL